MTWGDTKPPLYWGSQLQLVKAGIISSSEFIKSAISDRGRRMTPPGVAWPGKEPRTCCKQPEPNPCGHWYGQPLNVLYSAYGDNVVAGDWVCDECEEVGRIG